MRKQAKDNWEARFKDRLKDLEVPPDDKLWSGIDENIRPNRFRYAPLAAVLFLLFLSGSWLVLHQSEKEAKSSLSYLEEIPETEQSPTSGLEKKSNKPHKGFPVQSEFSAGNSLKEKGNIESGTEDADSDNLKIENGIPYSTHTKEVEKKELEGVSSPTPLSDSPLSPAVVVKRKIPDFTFDHFQAHEGPLLSMENKPAEEMKIVKPEKALESRMEIWSTLNPMFTYRKVKPNLEDNIKILELTHTHPLSLDRTGIQAAVGFSYFISRGLALKGGAFYRFTRNKWSYSYLPASPDSLIIKPIDEGIMNVNPVFTPREKSFVGTNVDLGILVGLRYSTGTFIRRNVNLEVQGAKNPKNGKILYYLSFDVDVEKELGQNFFLYAGPSFTWGMNNISPAKNEAFDLQPYSLGLKIGISYRLRKF